MNPASRALSSLFAALWLAASSSGCGSDATASDSTTGKRIRVHVDVAGAPNTRDSFTLDSGHTITLTRAALAIDAVQLFDGPPAVALARPPRRGWTSWFIGTAYAHPGHYQAGTALGEVTTPGVFDLFDVPSALGDGDGVTGTFRSGRVAISASAGATALSGASVLAEGTATKDGETLAFRLVAPRSELDKSLSAGHVDGCPFTEREAKGDLSVTLHVSPRVWLTFVDFTGAHGGTPASPVILGPESPQGVAFAVGVAQLSAYRFEAAP